MPTPGSIIMQGGEWQSAKPGTAFPYNIDVRVFDTGGQSMYNEPLIWSCAVSGASGVFESTGTRNKNTLTDGSGHSYSGTIIANSTLGDWQGLVQCVNALGINVAFTVRNVSVLPILTTIEINSGNNQNRASGSAFNPVSVQLLDQFNQAFPNGVVTFTFPSGRGNWFGHAPSERSLSFLFGPSGQGSSPNFQSNATVGALPITIECNGITVTANWSTVATGAPASVVVQAGNGQNTNVNTDFGAALQAKVLNGIGSPLSGVSVLFTAPPSGASCTFGGSLTETKVTNASGIAVSSMPHADNNPGSYAVTGAVTGVATPASFNLTNGGTPIQMPLTALHVGMP